MGKTLDGIVNLVGSMVDAGTPRETFGIEGYREFIRESGKVDSSTAKNKLAYDSFVGKSKDNVSKFTENYKGLDNKRDTALYRIEKVEELKKDSVKYLSKLGEILKDSETEVFNFESNLLESKDALNLLKEKYFEFENMYKLVKGVSLTKMDKVKNVFYSLFNKKKVKKDIETVESMGARVNLENEMNSLKNDIKYQSKILKDNGPDYKIASKKLNKAKEEISKVSEFISKTERIQEFYQKYMDDSNENLFPLRKDVISVAGRAVNEFISGRVEKYVPSANLRIHQAKKLNSRKKAIDSFMVGFFDRKFNVDLNGLSDNVTVPEVDYNIPFEVEDTRTFQD